MRIKKLKGGYEKLTEEKARLLGHLIGDGCVSQSGTNYVIKYEVKDKDLLDQFEADLVNVFGLKPTRGQNPSGKTGVLISYVSLRSKLAFNDLKRYCDFRSTNWQIPQEILKGDTPIKSEFLRALFDDEGTVFRQKKTCVIRLYSINHEGLKQVAILLKEFNIPSRIIKGYGEKRNVYGLIVEDNNVFKEKIGFQCERKKQKLEEIYGEIKERKLNNNIQKRLAEARAAPDDKYISHEELKKRIARV